jgi:imidazole glycerol phosphate synthase glutamine amidotransferase subunit
MSDVGIIATNIANLASVEAAFARLGATTRLINTPEEIANSTRVILPGVGAFAAAMTQLIKLNLVEALQERIRTRQPTLAICLGMQLLFDSSDESLGVQGLNIIPAYVGKINAPGLVVPQIGWNRVIPENDFFGTTPGYAYFANSFAVPAGAIPDWQVARFDYGNSYIAALQSGGVLACQFHPELSGVWGNQLIQNWLAVTC